jgi:aminomethyltransferase
MYTNVNFRYTGEDGFELSIVDDKITDVTHALLSSTDGSVQLSGLGARDSLRLEAGLCLYGNDIDEDTTPIEAGLTWTIGKRRRVIQHNEEDFPGAEIILRQLKDKPTRKRVGIVSEGPPARSHTPVIDASSGEQIGEITSGCPAPSMEVNNSNVAMAYLPSSFAKSGTKVLLKVRNKNVEATVTKMPFVPSRYYALK